VSVTREKASYWWVWTKHGRAPRYFHKTEASALREAKRLAKKHPSWKFHVLHGYAKFSVQTEPVAGPLLAEAA
jgi:hypothetical protein